MWQGVQHLSNYRPGITSAEKLNHFFTRFQMKSPTATPHPPAHSSHIFTVKEHEMHIEGRKPKEYKRWYQMSLHLWMRWSSRQHGHPPPALRWKLQIPSTQQRGTADLGCTFYDSNQEGTAETGLPAHTRELPSQWLFSRCSTESSIV